MSAGDDAPPVPGLLTTANPTAGSDASDIAAPADLAPSVDIAAASGDSQHTTNTLTPVSFTEPEPDPPKGTTMEEIDAEEREVLVNGATALVALGDDKVPRLVAAAEEVMDRELEQIQPTTVDNVRWSFVQLFDADAAYYLVRYLTADNAEQFLAAVPRGDPGRTVARRDRSRAATPPSGVRAADGARPPRVEHHTGRLVGHDP